ncbi:hypothetical protein BB561_001490 [Smittium simulii]|uniref:Sorting nexin MVP1 n=1 Tax=Smittium simulii TaxID=133385 RepID=A0A2T9YUA4_9FUNG|nr:hypothetical protein BB561_001490 [Smittium simulii]
MFDIPDPWGESTQAYQEEYDLITPCLNTVILAPIYEKTFKKLSRDSYTVSRSEFLDFISTVDIQNVAKKQIVFIAFQNNPMQLSKQNFFIALALISLAQKGIDISITSLEKFKNALPELNINLEPNNNINLQASNISSDYHNSLDENAFVTKVSIEKETASSSLNSFSGNSFDESRSSYTGKNISDNTIKSTVYDNNSNYTTKSGNSKNKNSIESSNNNTLKTGLATSSNNTWKLVDEDKEQYDLLLDDITIEEDPNRAGLVFKRVNYNVSSKFFGSKVVRRYNDFFSLSTYLGKKYFYRMLPLIPPKGFPVDRPFLDNRLKGLTTFSCAIMRLSYVRKDDFVKIFFNKNEDISKDLKLALNEVKLEKWDLNELSRGIPTESIKLIYESLQHYENLVKDDFDKIYKVYTSLDKVGKLKSAISDEILTVSEVPLNDTLENQSNKNTLYKPCLSENKLERNFSELSMNMSDISLLEKSMSEVISSTMQEYMKRYISLIYSMKLLIDRVMTSNKAAEVSNLEEKIISYKEQIYNLGESSTNSSSSNRLKTVLINDTKALNDIKYEESLAKIMLYHEIERYRRYKSFKSVIFKKIAQDYIRHHTLMVNSWKQVESITEMMPSDSSQFTD